MGQLYEVMTDFPTYHNDECLREQKSKKVSIAESTNQFQEWDSGLYLLQEIFFYYDPDEFRIEFEKMLCSNFVVDKHCRVIEDGASAKYSSSIRHLYAFMSAFPRFVDIVEYMRQMDTKFDTIQNVLPIAIACIHVFQC